MLAFGSKDGQVHLVGAAQGGRRPPLRTKHSMRVSCVAISADGRYLSAGCQDHSWKLWDAVTGAELLWARGHDCSDNCTCEFNSAGVGSHLDPRCPVEGHAGAVTAMAFSPCGRNIATGGEDLLLMVWDARSGQVRVQPKQPRDFRFTGKVGAVAFTPDGQRIAGACLGGVLLVWNLTSRTGVQAPARVNLSMPWNVPGWPWGQRRPTVHEIKFSPDLRRIAGCGSEGLFIVWDTRSGDALRSLSGLQTAFSIAIAADGALAAGGAPTAGVWDADSGQLRLWLRGHDGRTPCLCQPSPVNPYGSLSPYPSCPLVGHRAAVGAICFSQNGRALATGSDDGTCKLWDAATGIMLHSIRLSSPIVSIVLGRDWVADETDRRRARREAFAMGQLERLGAGSWVRQLEGEVIRSVLEKV